MGGEREAGLLRFSLRRLLVLIQFLALLSLSLSLPLSLSLSLPLFSHTVSPPYLPYLCDSVAFDCCRYASVSKQESCQHSQTLPRASLMINFMPSRLGV